MKSAASTDADRSRTRGSHRSGLSGYLVKKLQFEVGFPRDAQGFVSL